MDGDAMFDAQSVALYDEGRFAFHRMTGGVLQLQFGANGLVCHIRVDLQVVD